jgi:hypothetical protein
LLLSLLLLLATQDGYDYSYDQEHQQQLGEGGSEFYDQCDDPSAWPQSSEQLLPEEEDDDLFYYNSRPHSQLKQ